MRILIADDDSASLRLLQARLAGWGYDVVTCANGSAAWAILQQEAAPELAILDWEMPEMDGPEICRAVRRERTEPYTYILLLTTRNLKEDIVAGMEAGADDYLIKPFDAHELEVRLRAGRRILELQQQLISAREALRIQAHHDPLTGVLNRGAIVELLAAEVFRAKRERRSMGIVIADLDHFKRINDTYGHTAGDEVLREASRRMRASVRSYDAVGRYGGEEFLIVTPGCNLQCTFRLAERMRATIADTPVPIPGDSLTVTCSLGVAAINDRHREPDELIQAADAALYRAKRAGRNMVEREICSENPKPTPT